MLTNDQMTILERINNTCPICHDTQEFCPAFFGRRGHGLWHDGDRIHALREKLGLKPYVGRHRRGRHAA